MIIPQPVSMPSNTSDASLFRHQNFGTVSQSKKCGSYRSLSSAKSAPAYQKTRLVSSPVTTLISNGIVQCRDVTMEEAWSKYAVKKSNSSTSHSTKCSADLTLSAMQPIGSRAATESSPYRHLGPDATTHTTQSKSIESLTASLGSKVAIVSTGHSMTGYCPKKIVLTDLLQPRPPDTNLFRNESCISKSSYASNSSWISTNQAFFSKSSYTTHSTESQKFGIRSERFDKAMQTDLFKRSQATEVIVPTSKTAGVCSCDADFDDQQSELQSQLGRPTDSDDSPYAICSQYRLKPRFNLEDNSELKKANTLGPSRKLFGDLRKSILLFVSKTCHPKKYSEPTLEQESTIKDDSSVSSSSSRIESIYHSDDEAGKLWKSLEQTLGINLDCKEDTKRKRVSTSSMIKQRVETTSRIPRPRIGYRPSSKIVVEQDLGRSDHRASRLPIATCKLAKQCWEPREKRNSGMILRQGSGI